MVFSVPWLTRAGVFAAFSSGRIVVDEALDDADFLGHVVGVVLLDQVDLVALDAAAVVDHLEVGPEPVKRGAL